VTPSAQLEFWGAHAARVLAVAPSRPRTFSGNNFGEAPKSERGGACAPQTKEFRHATFYR
jgi:hypothetical protein